MCESVNHWAPGWFHKVKSSNDTWLSYEVILLQAGFDHPSELKGLLSECWNAAVFESSTSKTVCGRVWLDSYIESLFEGPESKHCVLTSSNIYGFDDGKTSKAT